MERRKTKIYGVCISLVLVLSMVLAIFGVLSLNTPNYGSSNLGQSVQPVVNGYTPENYLGGVGDLTDYMMEKGYGYGNTDFVAVSSEDELKAFLKQEGKYANKSGYLTTNISLNWNTSEKAYLAPNIEFKQELDGCGWSIKLQGDYNDASSGLDRRNDNSVGLIKVDAGDGYAMQSGTDSEGKPTFYQVDFHCFGGLVSVLGQGGKLSNFTFKIEGNHNFGYKDSWNNEYCDDGEDALTVFGGLVGYNEGGIINNVVVDLAANKVIGASEDISAAGNSIAKLGCTNAVYEGLVVGASKGGSLKNVTGIMGANSTLETTNRTGWMKKWNWISGKTHAGASFVGGIAGYVMSGCLIDNAYMHFNSGSKLVAKINKTRYNNAGGSGGDFSAYRIIGGIVAVNKGGSINAAMVSGNLNCMEIGGNSGRWEDDSVVSNFKNIYVGEGTMPGTMIYKNATGGDNTSGGDNYGSNVNQAYAEVKEKAVLRTDFADNGNGGVAIPYYFDHDVTGAVKIFVPQGKILWYLYGQAVYSQLKTGELSETKYPEAGSNTNISIGINDTGEIGIYKKDANGPEVDTKGERWIEMSDQSRKSRNGNVDSPLYYDGTKYELKMKIQGKLYDQGLQIINIGDLKNAMNIFNGKPVKLHCNDNGDYEHAVAYSNDQEKVVVLLPNVTAGMDRTISIQKRSLLVNTEGDYERNESTIFSGASVTFTKLSDDRAGVRSGLAPNEFMMWQDQKYTENVSIPLNVAGRQMLRPSTNNYILYKEVYFGNHVVLEEVGSYFSAVIKPHTIKVHESIYINGAAVGGEYDIMSAKEFNDSDKNAQKRTITISARLNDSHFTAEKVILIDKNGQEISNIEWKTSQDGLIYTTYTVSDDSLKEINFVNYKEQLYKVSINNGTETIEKNDYKYGDKVYLDAPEPAENKVFVGWQRADGSFLTYLPTYSLKVTENFTLTAIYEDIDTVSKPWKQIYRDKFDNILRECYSLNAAVDSNYRLPGKMGWTFKNWEVIKKDEANKIVEFRATFNRTELAPTVQVVYNNKDVVYKEYGAPITLEANKTYLVNRSKVEVGKEPLVIYAITDLNIEEIDPNHFVGTIKDTSMTYTSFLLDGTYYISITFVYGDADDVYDTEKNKPNININGFTKADYTEYVKQGNVYQISMVVTAKELECRFGNNTEITAFLSVLSDKPDDDGNYAVMYQFEEIMIFKRKD